MFLPTVFLTPLIRPRRGWTWRPVGGGSEPTRIDSFLVSVAILARTMQLPMQARGLSFHPAFTKMTPGRRRAQPESSEHRRPKSTTSRWQDQDGDSRSHLDLCGASTSTWTGERPTPLPEVHRRHSDNAISRRRGVEVTVAGITSVASDAVGHRTILSGRLSAEWWETPPCNYLYSFAYIWLTALPFIFHFVLIDIVCRCCCR